MSKFIIAIDAGHGVNGDSGAVHKNGRRECDDTLRLALAINEEAKRRGFGTVMTRTVANSPKIDRAGIAKNAGAGVFLCIHRNAFNGSAKGFEVWAAASYSSKTNQFAQAVFNNCVKVGVLANRGVKRDTGNNYSLISGVERAGIPAVLVEYGFVDNSDDNAIFDANFDGYVKATVQAVIDVFSVKQTAVEQSSPHLCSSSTFGEPDVGKPVPEPSVPDIPAHLRVDISSYDSFRAAVMGKYFDTDNSYGYQCYDGADALWRNIGGKQPPTDPNGGNRRLRSDGSARGAFEIAKYRELNAGTEFEIITDIKQIKRGDVIVYGTKLSSPYGHIGYADEDYSAGKSTIATLGQNQGGTGGVGQAAAFKVKSYPVSALVGAFRFKKWAGGASAFQPYRVRVNTDALNIRKGPGTGYDSAGVIRDKGVYTIVEESDGVGAGKWGKLKSGVGWVSLDWCVRV